MFPVAIPEEMKLIDEAVRVEIRHGAKILSQAA